MITEMAMLASLGIRVTLQRLPGSSRPCFSNRRLSISILRAPETQDLPSSSVAQAGWLGGRGSQDSHGGTVTLFPQNL